MAYTLDTEAVDLAYASGSGVAFGMPVSFSVRDIGRLRVTSGAIAASDPLVNPAPPAFTRPVPVGEFPVTLAIAHFPNGDERIAFAAVEIDALPPVRWELALTGREQDVATLGPDEYFGYAVDSGTGCFMDPAAGALLEARMRSEDDYFMTLIDQMQATYRATWSWLDARPSAERQENVVCFSSGLGDGLYPTFLGLNADGSVTRVLTDFLLLEH